MKTYKLRQGYLISLKRGEEIISKLKEFFENNKIKFAFIQGIGALQEIEIGRFTVSDKKFYSKKFLGEFEIVSLSGNLTILENNKLNIHLHIGFADNEFKLYGGHLIKGIVSAVAEIVVYTENITIKREFDENIGLNVI